MSFPSRDFPISRWLTAKVRTTNSITGSDEGGNEASIEATFMVSPAALAVKMTKENVSFVTEEIKTRSAASFEVVDVIDQDVVTGKFTVVAKTQYEYGNGKTLAIALNVKLAGTGATPEDAISGEDLGSDFTSAFIGTQYSAGGAINADPGCRPYERGRNPRTGN